MEAASGSRKAADIEVIEQLARAREVLLGEIHKVIVGQDEVIEQLLTALFCRGHCLLVGVPGLAKTLLISTIARVLKLKFRRIQFTPDLMPSDITGTEILEEDLSTGKKAFRFVPGPLFGHIILADEINRTPPKTQAALLQAMQEYQVTVGGQSYDLERPFFVLATQNPIEQEGTYPLPEAQLDRFMFNVLITYPTYDQEKEIVKTTTYDIESAVEPVLTGRDILTVQKIVRRVPIADHVLDYAVRLVRASRPDDPTGAVFVKDWLSWGCGPRAAQYLVLGAKARTILHGRYSVTCDDVRSMAIPVMRHRMFTNFNADAEGIDTVRVVNELLKVVQEPGEADYA